MSLWKRVRHKLSFPTDNAPMSQPPSSPDMDETVARYRDLPSLFPTGGMSVDMDEDERIQWNRDEDARVEEWLEGSTASYWRRDWTGTDLEEEIERWNRLIDESHDEE